MNTEDRLKQMMDAARGESNATEDEWNDFVHRAHRPLYMRRAAAVVGAAALIAVGAFSAVALMSNDPSPSPLPPAASNNGSPEPDDTAQPNNTVTVPPAEHELWFVQNERLSWGTTEMGGEFPNDVSTDGPESEEAAYWLNILVGGPTGPDQEVGATTAIPEATELLGVSREGDVLYVDLSSEFESGGGSLSMQMRVAQVVYTGTQFEGVEAVRITIEGEQVDAIGGEGVIVSEPLTRRDFQDVAPYIVVESPKPGETISSPVTVTGFANVYEANVGIRLFDENGNKLRETFTTATCGTGCWGDFSESVKFRVNFEQEGRLEVLTYSAEDGSPQNVVSIPVTLVP
ncbi:MAG: hypothetical protein QOH26_16 [Actinomycetota bacterium]|jgi:spore germination protein GerM|nr:hypothetical protein [Actinomycetota bacterium]